jgi:hypothetical protein
MTFWDKHTKYACRLRLCSDTFFYVCVEKQSAFFFLVGEPPAAKQWERDGSSSKRREGGGEVCTHGRIRNQQKGARECPEEGPKGKKVVLD